MVNKLKVLQRNAIPPQDEIDEYRKNNKMHRRQTNLRFGKVVIMCDQDLDG